MSPISKEAFPLLKRKSARSRIVGGKTYTDCGARTSYWFSTAKVSKVELGAGVGTRYLVLYLATIELADCPVGQFKKCQKLGGKVSGFSTESFLSTTPHLVDKLGSRPVSS